MNNHERSDEQLVRAFQAGDESAFSVFVTRHQDRVYRLAMLWLRDGSQADDALQETFLRSYTGLGRFRFRAQPHTWLLRVLRNVCFEENRRHAAQVLGAGVDSEQTTEPDLAAAQDRPRQLARLHNALKRLPDRQRDVVMLRVFEDLSIAETASIMGCRRGTVKAHLNKAINGLRSMLAQVDGTVL
ncbi:MAG: RNA polymerase sigma factor [Gammaproteobacteria bacterium]|nr:RNA polymerase sigma factor [Gammaproteobacteria bacterium]